MAAKSGWKKLLAWLSAWKKLSQWLNIRWNTFFDGSLWFILPRLVIQCHINLRSGGAEISHSTVILAGIPHLKHATFRIVVPYQRSSINQFKLKFSSQWNSYNYSYCFTRLLGKLEETWHLLESTQPSVGPTVLPISVSHCYVLNIAENKHLLSSGCGNNNKHCRIIL